MNNEEIKGVLKEIANTPAKKLTKEQKAAVKEYAQTYGIEFNPKARCNSCYIDTAVLIYNRLQDDEVKESTETDTRRFVLRTGVDVFFGSIRVNAATLTDELAERIIARGFDKRNFVKCG